MPYRDGTGPMGQGPMTGRGLGLCGTGQARGFGWGRGFGRGWGKGFGRDFGWRAPVAPVYANERMVPVYQEPTPEREKEILKAEKSEIERELKEINKRLQELK